MGSVWSVHVTYGKEVSREAEISHNGYLLLVACGSEPRSYAYKGMENADSFHKL